MQALSKEITSPGVGKLTDQYNNLLYSLSFISKDGLYVDICFGVSTGNFTECI